MLELQADWQIATLLREFDLSYTSSFSSTELFMLARSDKDQRDGLVGVLDPGGNSVQDGAWTRNIRVRLEEAGVWELGLYQEHLKSGDYRIILVGDRVD